MVELRAQALLLGNDGFRFGDDGFDDRLESLDAQLVVDAAFQTFHRLLVPSGVGQRALQCFQEVGYRLLGLVVDRPCRGGCRIGVEEPFRQLFAADRGEGLAVVPEAVDDPGEVGLVPGIVSIPEIIIIGIRGELLSGKLFEGQVSEFCAFWLDQLEYPQAIHIVSGHEVGLLMPCLV